MGLAMKREDVEALLAASQPGSDTFVHEMGNMTRRKLRALCRAWLAVDGAEVVKVNSQLGNTIVARVAEGAHYKGKRVRIVAEVPHDGTNRPLGSAACRALA